MKEETQLRAPEEIWEAIVKHEEYLRKVALGMEPWLTRLVQAECLRLHKLYRKAVKEKRGAKNGRKASRARKGVSAKAKAKRAGPDN